MTRKPSPAPISNDVAARMSKQKRRDTKPEMAVRSLLHANGFRFRVNFPVPGMPRRSMDIAFTKQRVAIFIDGCFWHGCPTHANVPKHNSGWWTEKITRNRTRDESTNSHLKASGWTVVRVWEHESPGDAVDRIVGALH